MKKILYILILVTIVIGTMGIFSNKALASRQIYPGEISNLGRQIPKETNNTFDIDDGDMLRQNIFYATRYTGANGQVYAAVYDRNGAGGNDDTQVGIYSVNDAKYLPNSTPIPKGTPEDTNNMNRIGGAGSSNSYLTADAAATAARAQYEAQQNAQGKQLPQCINEGGWTRLGLPEGINVEGCLIQGSYYFLKLVAFLLWLAAWFFNFTLGYSLNIGNFLKDVPIVNIGWKIARDVANICFIFILLYIAINTILQTKSADTKKLLIRVIIVAILLNFSLFFAKVVIDTSNILALQFYGKMGGTNVTTLSSFATSNRDQGIAQQFVKGLGVLSLYQSGDDGNVAPITQGANLLAITAGGAVLLLVTAFVFIAGAILFIIRTIVLIFLMILAPLAFLSMILPKTEQYWNQWLSALINQSFFATIYMALLYIVIAIVKGDYPGAQNTAIGDIAKTTTGEGRSLGSLLMGSPDSIGVLYTFVILIGLMLGSLYVAKMLGAHGGDFARNMAGKATFGAASWMGRQSAGRLAQMASKSDFIGKMRNSTGLKTPLRAIAGLVDKGAAGTYDMRASALGGAAGGAVGGLGTVGGEGGFRKIQEEDKKKKAEYQKIVTLAGKKSELQAALKSGNDEQIQSALYKFSDSEYGELGSDMLTNPAVVRNAKPSQIASVTDEKFDKLRVDQKKRITDTRESGVTHAVEGTIDHSTPEGATDISHRYVSLSQESKDKFKSNSLHGANWAQNALNAIERDPGNASAVQAAINTHIPIAHQADFHNMLKRAHTKNELGKLSTEEKSKLNIDFITKPGNEELLRNLDADTLKAIMDRKDLPPPQKEKIKTARQGMLVQDLARGTAGKDDAKDLMKGMKASDLNKIISHKSPAGVPQFYIPGAGTVGGGPIAAPGSPGANFASLLTDSQLKDLQEEGLDPAIRKAIGAQIMADPGARGHSYVSKRNGVNGGWR